MYVDIHARVIVKLKREITPEEFQGLVNKLSDRFDYSYSFHEGMDADSQVMYFDHDGPFETRNQGNGFVQFLDEVHRQSTLIEGAALVDYDSSCTGNYSYYKGDGTSYNDMVSLVDSFLATIEGNIRRVRSALKSFAV